MEREGFSTSVKMEVDYSSTCDEKLPQLQEMAKAGNLKKALEGLLALEKQTRTSGDMLSTGRILVLVVQICFEAQDWNLLCEYITLLSKRRGQLKQAVVKMVQESCSYIDKLPSRTLQYQLVDTLRKVTEGKIYVEVEQARLTHQYCKMKEEDGDITAAATTMQELQVETYGSMDKKEKVELILEQMRYCLANKDYIRTQIISKKINTKFFEDDATQDLKIKFYSLMIELDQHDERFLMICRHYRAIMKTSSVEADAEKRLKFIRCSVLYLLLSPYDNEQSDLLHNVLSEKYMEELPTFKALLELFKTQELIDWKSLCDRFEDELRDRLASGVKTEVFDSSEQGEKRWKTFKNRVVEHNIRIMAKYYTRVSLKRMSQLLNLENQQVEQFLCDMIVAGTVLGKIDRPEGVVNFQPKKDPSEILNDWSNCLNTLMALIAKTTHMINKEEMVHKNLLATPSVNSGTSSSGTAMEVE